MYTQDELSSLYGFLKSTGEGNLRKMLIGGRLTDTHLRVLLKVVRGCSESEFIDCVQNQSFPKIKLSIPESAIRDHFWPQCLEGLASVGLVSDGKKAA